ncbi:hypothetical protein MCERHM63_00827 [Candidatus Methylopumilus planktonicus]|uniref:hypothetical protein n=1 Tax=Candidatus Methylopumilus planktonicus TaxID=1581557 RepID=UPI003BEF10F2
MKKIYDILIVGSGPITFGALAGIGLNQTIGMISQGKGGGYNRDSLGDYSYRIGFGGGLDFWHGVSSLELFRQHFPKKIAQAINFFKSLYNETEPLPDISSNYIYVPNNKISEKNLIELIKKKNCDFLVDEALFISENDGLIKLTCKNRVVYCKKILICAGAVGSQKLLINSGLAKKRKVIGNHLNGYGDFNIETPKSQRQVVIGKHGHFKIVSTGVVNDKKFMIYPRPALFDFKNPDTVKKFKSSYSRKDKFIYKYIAKSMSPGLLLEALYNRYGYWMAGDNSNQYFQIETDDIYSIDQYHKIQINENRLNVFLNQLKLDHRFTNVGSDSVVSGIHFYNTIDAAANLGLITNEDDWNKKIIICDSSSLRSLGGCHHTFSLMAMNYIAMKSIYE